MADDSGTKSHSPAVADAAADVIQVPEHELVRLIGKGSYGEVWLARNALGTFRAVKVVYERTFRHKRPFDREFSGVRNFEPISRLHEGLVDILQVGRNDALGYFYCIMELAEDTVSGPLIDPEKYSPRTLSRELARRKRLPIDECHRLGVAIASALDFLHTRGLVHRDVKPSNVIFVNGIPKLADVGLVAELAEARSYVGTEGFIPPEGPGTPQADLYSFGKVLYEMSTGKDRQDYPEPPTLIGEPAHETGLIEFNKVVLKACRADPSERYQSAKEMIADLSTLQRGELLLPENASRRSKAKVFRIAAGFLAVITGLVMGVRWFDSHRAVAPPPGLIASWRGEGDARDSVGTNNGHLYGVGFAEGKAGQAFDLVGQGHRVYVPDSADFKLTNSLTIEGWVFARVGGGYIFMRGGEAWGLDPYALHVSETGEIDFSLDQSRTNYIHLLAPLPRNQWKHVAATLDGTTGEMRIYIDAALAVRTNTAVRPLGNLDPGIESSIGIGNVGSMTRDSCFNGFIDEIALYSRALSPTEIKSIYRAGSYGKRTPPPRVAARAKKDQPPAVPAPSGLIGFWPGNGDARDAVSTNHGILHNVTFAPGMVNAAFRFNGSNSFVEIPPADCLNVGTQMTIECWFKADLDNVMITCCQGIVTTDFYALGVQSNPVGLDFSILFTNGSTSVNVSDANNGGAVVSSGEWHHTAATYDGAALRLYIDGRPWRNPMAALGTIPPMLPGSFLAIGSESGRGICSSCRANRYFKGLIDEVSIYNRALSAAEISALYNAGGGGKRVTTLR